MFGAESVFPVLFHQLQVRKFFLRIFVKKFAIGVGWGGIKMKIEFFHILSMIAFSIGESEEPFFYDGIFPIPECWSKT